MALSRQETARATAATPTPARAARRLTAEAVRPASDSTVGAQTEILLQLVADAVELRLQRAARARAATASGRLRTVS